MTKNFILLISSAVLISNTAGTSTPTPTAAADTYKDIPTYSDVLEDLKKDPAFDVSDYGYDESDRSINCIQIAESSSGELFVYVYQPSCETLDIRATSINISTAINDSFHPINYSLVFVNNNAVFYKYLVKDFKVKNDVVRYYSVPAILRRSLDDESDKGSETVSEISYNVGRLWTACTYHGEVTYGCTEEETIVISSKYTGELVYEEGMKADFWGIFTSRMKSHFVAFSTDKPIDRLIEVQMSYIYSKGYNWQEDFSNGTKIQEKDKTKDLTISEKETAHTDPLYPWRMLYEWKRIEKKEDFLKEAKEQSIELTEQFKAGLEDKQWILRFLESDLSVSNYSYSDDLGFFHTGQREYFTNVSDVIILRLKFETDNNVYNLGVVDNKTTSDGIADNNVNPGVSANNILKSIMEFFQNLLSSDIGRWILGILIAIIAFIVLINLSPQILTAVFKIVWKIITIPFKVIYNLFKTRRQKNKNNSN